MILTSDAFLDNESIPTKYACDGENVNPPLTLSLVPKDTKSLVLIVEDPDAPVKSNFTHWLLYNMPASLLQILKNTVPGDSMVGLNDVGTASYQGPCPPSGTHRYFFKVFALNNILDLPRGAQKDQVIEAMKGHIIESAELVGLYTKK